MLRGEIFETLRAHEAANEGGARPRDEVRALPRLHGSQQKRRAQVVRVLRLRERRRQRRAGLRARRRRLRL